MKNPYSMPDYIFRAFQIMYDYRFNNGNYSIEEIKRNQQITNDYSKKYIYPTNKLKQ